MCSCDSCTYVLYCFKIYATRKVVELFMKKLRVGWCNGLNKSQQNVFEFWVIGTNP